MLKYNSMFYQYHKTVLWVNSNSVRKRQWRYWLSVRVPCERRGFDTQLSVTVELSFSFIASWTSSCCSRFSCEWVATIKTAAKGNSGTGSQNTGPLTVGLARNMPIVELKAEDQGKNPEPNLRSRRRETVTFAFSHSFHEYKPNCKITCKRQKWNGTSSILKDIFFIKITIIDFLSHFILGAVALWYPIDFATQR